MPLGNWNVEWLNLNSQRKYPLAEECTGTDITGSFTIPQDFLLELDLPVSAGADVDAARFFVRNVGAYATGYSVVVGYQPDGGDPVNVATALIPRQGHARNAAYALGGVVPFEDTLGKAVVGRLENIDEQPPGFWTFTLETARIEPDCVRPQIRGVSGLVAVNGEQRSVTLRGVVELRAGKNFQLAVSQSGGETVIRLDAVSGEGTIDDCVCAGDTEPPPPIRTINGIAPTPDGNFNLLGSDCIQVTAADNGVRLVDVCAKPCCGCEELERITRDLERFGSQQAAVTDFVGRLGNAVDTMSLVVLGSKTNDRSCVSGCD
jgi:hypothetical protein